MFHIKKKCNAISSDDSHIKRNTEEVFSKGFDQGYSEENCRKQ